MLEQSTPPDAHIFSLIPVANAYTSRDVSVVWQSAEGDRLVAGLRMAAQRKQDWFFDWKAEWPGEPLRAIRFRAPTAYPNIWDIAEIELFSDGERVPGNPQWELRSWPNFWEAPLALDGRRSTVWRTWEPVRRGMYFEVDLEPPARVSSCVLQSHTPISGVPLEIYGKDFIGRWRLLSANPAVVQRPPEDLRFQATFNVRRAGYEYLLVPIDPGGNGPLGNTLVAEAPQWGIAVAGRAGSNVLFRIR
jgi:hypothetical protein